MISVYVQKTLATAKSDTPLTSGSVGTVVQFYFSSDWEGLNRTAVFETSAYQKETAELNADNSAVIPESVMAQDGVTLFIGVYGTNEGGSIVVPTVYANCGEIKTGANTEPGGEPVTPSQAQQLQNQIDDLDNRVDALEAGGGGSVELDTTLSVEGKAADAKAVGDRLLVLENNTPAEGGGGLTVAQVNALDGMFKIASYTEDPTSAYAAFKAAFGIGDSGGEEEPDEPVTPEVTLTSISATYSGGDVDAGTALTDLTGIVVTAHYSDGSTATVTDYTLSGEIVGGSNTITVSYGGKTTTFTVTGVAVVEPLYGVFWPPKGHVADWNNHDWAGVENFAFTANSGQYIDAGFPQASFIRLDKLQGTVYIRTLTRNQYGVLDLGYRLYANADGEISTGGFTNIVPTTYYKFGNETKIMEVGGTIYYFVLYKFEIPAGQYGYFVSQASPASNDYFVSADKISIDENYQQYYTLFTSDPSDRITEGAVEVS